MAIQNSRNGLIKKATAVILGITMAFGALMLPQSMTKDSFTAAYAATAEVDGCTYQYDIKKINGVQVAIITGVEGQGETLEIPSVITHDGVELSVYMADNNFLKGDTTVKNVIFPESLKKLGYCVLDGSIIENITLPDGLEHIGVLFAADCKNLKSVKYDGTSIKNGGIEWSIFSGSDLSGITNEKGAICLGNWLIKYTPSDDTKEFKPSELGNDGMKIEYIGHSAIPSCKNITTLDLSGIKYISDNNFLGWDSLTTIKNTDSIENIGSNVLRSSPWYEKAREKDLIKLGSLLLYYRTNSNVIDLTANQFSDIKNIAAYAFCDCENVDTLHCTSDITLGYDCFYQDDTIKPGRVLINSLPEVSTCKIKTIYLDGRKLEYSKDEPVLDPWLKNNISYLYGSVWLKNNVEAKAKDLFEQLDIPYYGLYNDKKGTLSKTDEFYTVLKMHNYISTYDYDLDDTSSGEIDAFLRGGQLTCGSYVTLNKVLLSCAGVDHLSLSDARNAGHCWDAVKIGDEWFECDAGWDEQYSHTFPLFALSSAHMLEIGGKYHDPGERGYTKGERTLGDINGDDARDQQDVDLLWGYLKGKVAELNAIGADVNFDGNIDVTDAVLLDNLVNGKALDVNFIPTDGLAPTHMVAFVNGTDYDHIKYTYTDREGYITLPDYLFKVPEGKKLRYNVGKPGERVRVSKPFEVIQTQWVDKSTPNFELGDVNGDGTIDIEDAVAIIQHINGMAPLTNEQESCADVSKDKNIDIDDAVILISYINGNSTF